MGKPLWALFWGAMGAMVINIVSNLITPAIQERLGIVGQLLSFPWTPTIVFGIIAILLLGFLRFRSGNIKPASATGGGYNHRRLTESPLVEDSDADVVHYRTRAQMREMTGGLTRELQDVTHAWASFEVGSYYVSIHDNLKKKLERIVLMHPASPLLKYWTGFDESTARAEPTIREATKKALAAGSKVRWCNGPILNCVIGQPNTHDAWARLQTQLPHIQADKWPNTIITRRTNPEYYGNIVDAFEAMWNQSEEPTL